MREATGSLPPAAPSRRMAWARAVIVFTCWKVVMIVLRVSKTPLIGRLGVFRSYKQLIDDMLHQNSKQMSSSSELFIILNQNLYFKVKSEKKNRVYSQCCILQA
jgi:hypothetical protein